MLGDCQTSAAQGGLYNACVSRGFGILVFQLCPECYLHMPTALCHPEPL